MVTGILIRTAVCNDKRVHAEPYRWIAARLVEELIPTAEVFGVLRNHVAAKS